MQCNDIGMQSHAQCQTGSQQLMVIASDFLSLSQLTVSAGLHDCAVRLQGGWMCS